MFSSQTPTGEPWRRIVEASPDGIVIVDADGRMRFVNSSLRRLFDYSETDLEGEPVELLLPERYREAHADYLRQYMKEPEPRPMATGMGLYGWRRDGSEFPVDISLTPVTIDATRYVVATIRDMTEQRSAHRKAIQTDKLEAVRRLAGGLAHEFNNLLTAIRGSADLALDELSAEHPAREDLSQIRQSVETSRELVRGLLAFSQKHGDERAEIVDLGTLIPDLRNTFEDLISDDVDLDIQLEDASMTVRIDPVLLRQALVDLVVNANDAMSEGGRLRIRSRREPAPLWRASEGDDAEVVLLIKDSGVGIPPKNRERIFDPFFSTKAPVKRVGLGLSAVYGIVRRAGGTIDVESDVGKGTTFTVRLPLADPE